MKGESHVYYCNPYQYSKIAREQKVEILYVLYHYPNSCSSCFLHSGCCSRDDDTLRKHCVGNLYIACATRLNRVTDSRNVNNRRSTRWERHVFIQKFDVICSRAIFYCCHDLQCIIH